MRQILSRTEMRCSASAFSERSPRSVLFILRTLSAVDGSFTMAINAIRIFADLSPNIYFPRFTSPGRKYRTGLRKTGVFSLMFYIFKAGFVWSCLRTDTAE